MVSKWEKLIEVRFGLVRSFKKIISFCLSGIISVWLSFFALPWSFFQLSLLWSSHKFQVTWIIILIEHFLFTMSHFRSKQLMEDRLLHPSVLLHCLQPFRLLRKGIGQQSAVARESCARTVDPLVHVCPEDRNDPLAHVLQCCAKQQANSGTFIVI